MEVQKELGHANGKAIEVIPGSQVAVTGEGESVERQLARAEKQIAFRKGILRLIAANINPEHIILYGKEGEETLWLDKVACNRILSWAGARLEMDSVIQEKRYDGVEGPYIDFEVWGTVITEGDGRAVRVMGNRATYDDFYAKRTRYVCPHEGCGAATSYETGCPQHGRVRGVKEEYYLPLEEVDIPSIKQAAITNLWNKAVAGLGFTPTVQELREAGLDLQNRKRVEFNGKKDAAKEASTSQPTSSQVPSGNPSTASKGAAKPAPSPSNAAPAPSTSPKQPPPKQPSRAKAGKASDPPLGKGIVSEAYLNKTQPNKTTGKGGGNRYVKVVQNGFFLFSYHDKDVETKDGPKNILELIVAHRGQFCDFIVETKPSSATGEPTHYINGANRIGTYQWENGEPVIYQREPGDYEATDEDMPF